MNKIFYLFSVVYLLLLPALAFSQDLDKMSEQARTKYLLKKSKEAVLRYGAKEYYYESLPPEITSQVLTRGIFQGQTMYTVIYPTDTTRYYMTNGFAAKILFLSGTGEIYSITYGNMRRVFGDKLKQRPSESEKTPFSVILRKEWDEKIRKDQEAFRKEQARLQRIYDERKRRERDSLRQLGDTLR